MKRLWVLIMILSACGCASSKQNDAVFKAIHGGLINGIDTDAQLETIPWSFPSTYMGPYTDIHGFSGTITNDPTSCRRVILFVGKVRETKDWEVFSALLWTNGEWVTLPVTLSNKSK